MIQLELSDEDKIRVKQERYEHPDPVIQKRLSALHFKCLGYSNSEACRLADISTTTLTRVMKNLSEGGLEAVLQNRDYRAGGELENNRDSIEEHFRKHPPATVKEACAAIKKLTSIERKDTQVRKFLHRIGMKPRKVGGVPGKADRENQEEFKKKFSSQS